MLDFIPWIRNSRDFYRKATLHPANHEIIAYLKRKSFPLLLAKVAPWSEFSFGAIDHPELSTFLDDIAKGLPRHYARYLFGYSVHATLNGVIFSIAINMNTLGFRLPEKQRREALSASANPMRYLGNDWVSFDPWKPRVTDQERIQLFAYWGERAYKYAEDL